MPDETKIIYYNLKAELTKSTGQNSGN